MAEHKDRIEQTIEMLVYAPIGAGLYLKDMGPTFVNMFVARGRAEIDRRQAQVQQRTTTARSVGQVAVAFGVPMARQRVEREVGNARQRAQSFLESMNGGDAPAAPVRPRPAPRTSPAPAPVDVAPAPTNGVSARRSGPADPGVRRAVGVAGGRAARPASHRTSSTRSVEYEGAHRNRRTILGKIDQIEG